MKSTKEMRNKVRTELSGGADAKTLRSRGPTWAAAVDDVLAPEQPQRTGAAPMAAFIDPAESRYGGALHG